MNSKEKLASSSSNVPFRTEDLMLQMLQIGAESEAVDDELIREAAGLHLMETLMRGLKLAAAENSAR